MKEISRNKNTSSNDKIMEYYQKYGQNRDLERYLRFRKNSTRSSSDGSLQAYNENKEPMVKKITGRSMENLATLNLPELKCKTPEHISDDHNKKTEPMKRSDKLVISTSDSKKEKKSGKNYKYNVESTIEIDMPSQSFQILPKQIVPEAKSLGTQTVDEEPPIYPIMKTDVFNKDINKKEEKTPNNTIDLSPNSSITSNRQKLEWDSLGDIGYDPNDKYLIYGADEMTEDEREHLKKYFAQKGMNFERLVFVAKNQQTLKKPMSQVTSPPKSTKEIWKDVFNKYKEKYIDQSINQVSPEAQSTPKLPVEKKGIQNIEMNKSTQTSLIRNVSKGIQANNEYTEDKTIPETTAGSNIETADSFEYFSSSSPPQPVAKNESKKSSSQNTNEKSSIWTSESSASREGQQPKKYEEEIRLAFALFQAITESKTMLPTVKKSLTDKIFKKLIKHDKQRRNQEQFMQDYQHLVKKVQTTNEHIRETITCEPSPSHIATNSSRSDVKDSKVSSSKQSNLQSSRISPLHSTTTNSSRSDRKHSKISSNKHSSLQCSKDYQKSILDHSSISGEEIVVKKATQATERRIKRAMEDALRPMTYSEVDYQNHQNTKAISKSIPLKDLLKKDRVSPITIQEIDQEIEQLRYIKERIIMAKENKDRRTTAANLRKANKENTYENMMNKNSGYHHTPPISTNNSSWNSHCNMKNFINNSRSKLETPRPSSQESVVTFINNRKGRFIENYGKKQRNHLFHDSINNVGQRPTAPPSEEVFMSSGSISIPINTNTNTTMHQYDMKNYWKVIGTQTTESILQTKPIYETRPSNYGSTEIVINSRMKNKQQQTSPKSCAYIIQFQDKSNFTVSENSTPGNTTSDPSYSRNTSSSMEKGTKEMMTLKEHFVTNRPKTASKCEERRKTVNVLNELRAKRNEQRQKLFLLTSEDTLEKGDYKIPAKEPMSAKRIFTSKDIIKRTKRHLCELPAYKKEVERKKTLDDINNFKKKCLIMRKVYTKNLRRRTLQGQVNLSNSIRVVSN